MQVEVKVLNTNISTVPFINVAQCRSKVESIANNVENTERSNPNLLPTVRNVIVIHNIGITVVIKFRV